MLGNGFATSADHGNAAPPKRRSKERALEGPKTFFPRFRFGALEFATDGNGGLVLEDPKTGARYGLD
jgi:hypothetical protein